MPRTAHLALTLARTLALTLALTLAVVALTSSPANARPRKAHKPKTTTIVFSAIDIDATTRKGIEAMRGWRRAAFGPLLKIKPKNLKQPLRLSSQSLLLK